MVADLAAVQMENVVANPTNMGVGLLHRTRQRELLSQERSTDGEVPMPDPTPLPIPWLEQPDAESCRFAPAGFTTPRTRPYADRPVDP